MTDNTSRPRILTRRAAATVTALLSTVAALALAQPAHAGPGGAVNIRGDEPWNTDEMMAQVCGTSGDTGYQDWYVNINTGELRDHSSWRKEPVWHKDDGTWTLQPGWERFEGHCAYPVASTWTYQGAWRPISDTRTNCTDSGYSVNLNRAYGTTTSYSHTVGGSTSATASIASWFSATVGASYTYSWSLDKSLTVSSTDSIEIAAQKTTWIDASPTKRVVRVTPVFKVESYTWNPTGKREDVIDVESWRGRGYNQIYSYGNYIDAVADELRQDGTPKLKFRKKESPAGSECD